MRRARFRPGTTWLAVPTAALLVWGAAGGAVAQAAGAVTQAADAVAQAEGASQDASAVAQGASPQAPGTGSVAALDRFLDGLRSLRTRFSQTVTGAHGRIVAQATGELIVLRPGKFRWEIHPVGQSAEQSAGQSGQDGGQSAGQGGGQSAGQSGGQSGAGQLLVADGRNLWFYDADLQQVTVRPQSTALTATPAMLLSGGTNALSAFEVSGAGRKDGLDWVQVVPKAADADFKEARLGFSGNELERMILEDKLGQTATLSFQDAERNVPVAPSEVSFTPPAGADVIGTPQK